MAPRANPAAPGVAAMAFRADLRALAAELAAIPPHSYEAPHIRLARQLVEAVEDRSYDNRGAVRQLERRLVKELFRTLTRGDATRSLPRHVLVGR